VVEHLLCKSEKMGPILVIVSPSNQKSIYPIRRSLSHDPNTSHQAYLSMYGIKFPTHEFGVTYSNHSIR
jgi:hypothetical protein